MTARPPKAGTPIVFWRGELCEPVPAKRSVFGLFILGLIGTALVFVSGCRTTPVISPAAPADARRAIERFNAQSPVGFSALNAVLIEFKPHWWWPTVRFTALGASAVDRQAGSFTVTGLTPFGMTLFDISGTNGLVVGRLAIPAVRNPDDFIRAMGKDIARAYLDPVPPPDAGIVSVANGKILMRQTLDNQTVDYVFAGTEPRLVEKRFREGRRTVCEIRYSEYRAEGAHLFPGRIVLRNFRPGYRLTIRLTEVRSQR